MSIVKRPTPDDFRKLPVGAIVEDREGTYIKRGPNDWLALRGGDVGYPDIDDEAMASGVPAHITPNPTAEQTGDVLAGGTTGDAAKRRRREMVRQIRMGIRIDGSTS